MSTGRKKVIALSGGVGGAKLAHGLSKILPADDLLVVVNVGDDFEHMGLHVSPDIDTNMYTLSGFANPETGWGRVGESWNFIEVAKELGAEDWFSLGDKDLAIHVTRTHRLKQNHTLSDITNDLCRKVGIECRIVPVTDDPVRTIVTTDQGELAFQHYFVRERCNPAVTSIAFKGAEQARLHPIVEAWCESDELAGIIVCPSNPYLSVDPLLAIPGFRSMLSEISVPIVAVSPIVGGKAIKGPAAKMMAELDLEVSAVTVADHYKDFLSGIVIDNLDSPLSQEIEKLGMAVKVTDTIMKSDEGRAQLAKQTVDFLMSLSASDARNS